MHKLQRLTKYNCSCFFDTTIASDIVQYTFNGNWTTWYTVCHNVRFIYFLWLGSTLRYIGKTKSTNTLKARLEHHISNKVFDSVSVVAYYANNSEIHLIESLLIRYYKPYYNKVYCPIANTVKTFKHGITDKPTVIKDYCWDTYEEEEA